MTEILRMKDISFVAIARSEQHQMKSQLQFRSDVSADVSEGTGGNLLEMESTVLRKCDIKHALGNLAHCKCDRIATAVQPHEID